MTTDRPWLGGELHGATPLDDADADGLRPDWIATRADLNAAEFANIEAATIWALTARRRWTTTRVLDRQSLLDLHRRMFGDVWRWAGAWRTRETNIGVSPPRIVTEVENLLGDVRAQTADPKRLAWPADKVAVRFHHRLVSIHPFPNGNGRHARLAADLLVIALGRSRFSWGAGHDLTSGSTDRSVYLAALRAADRDFDYAPLLSFARS